MRHRLLNDLAAFAVVARERSFTRAAGTLGISPSALSHAMRGLEDRLGVLLLARTTRAVSPTEAGQRLLSRLTVAMSEIDLGLAELADRASTSTGSIRLTTFRYFADTILRKRLPAFLRDHPAVQVEINVDDRLTDVVTAEFDGGIRFGNHVAKGAAAVRIGPDISMVVVATPEYLARSGSPLSTGELADHACLNYRITSTGAVFTWTFSRADEAAKVNVTGPLLANYGPLLLDAVRAGIGLGFMLEQDVAAELADGRLVRVLPEWSSVYPGPHLYHLDRARASPAMAALIHYLKEHQHTPDERVGRCAMRARSCDCW